MPSNIICVSISDENLKYVKQLKEKDYGVSNLLKDAIDALKEMDYISFMDENIKEKKRKFIEVYKNRENGRTRF